MGSLSKEGKAQDSFEIKFKSDFRKNQGFVSQSGFKSPSLSFKGQQVAFSSVSQADGTVF